MNDKKNKPLKRHKNLQPLSRDHHHTLLLSWKIRQGFKKKVDPQRMKKYCDWFYINHLQPHFEIEEQYVFPMLGNDHDLVKKALSEHRRLRKLFLDTAELERSLSLLEEELERHIRFEERVLFQEIQKNTTTKQLKNLTKIHREEDFIENTEDEFWK